MGGLRSCWFGEGGGDGWGWTETSEKCMWVEEDWRKLPIAGKDTRQPKLGGENRDEECFPGAGEDAAPWQPGADGSQRYRGGRRSERGPGEAPGDGGNWRGTHSTSPLGPAPQ